MSDASRIGRQHPTSGAFAPVDASRWSSADSPLGAHLTGGDATFAVFSSRATRVLLELYDQATGSDAAHDYWLERNPADNIWRARIAAVPPGTFYAFRCWGPNSPCITDSSRPVATERVSTCVV